MSEHQQADGYEGAAYDVVPSGWEVTSFTKTVERKRVHVGKVKKSDYQPHGRFPVIDQSQNPIGGYTDDEGLIYKGELPVVVFGDHTRIFKYVDHPFVCGADGTKILIPNRDILEPRFYFYALTSLRIPSKGYNRHFKLLKEQSLLLPPMDEQRRIARVLSTIQEAIEKQEAVIAAARELKRSLMQRLFTYGPYAEPAVTKETEIGEIPEHWKLVRLEEIATLLSGGTPSKKRTEWWNGTIPWVSP